MNYLEWSASKKRILSVLILVVISRLAMYLVGYLGDNLFSNFTSRPVYQTVVQQDGWSSTTMELPATLAQTHVPHVSELNKFDSSWYTGIAEHGYDTYKMNKPHPAANWVFFPLFPILMSVVHFILHFANMTLIGTILSNLFLVGALVYIHKMAEKRFHGLKAAREVVLLVLIYPSSIFFSVPYTESLFLFLSSMTLYNAYEKRYGLAFLAAGLSVVSRPPGVANLMFVIGSILVETRFKFRTRDLRYAAYLVLSLIPLGVFLAYMGHLTGDFLAPFHEESLNWNRHTAMPFVNYVRYLIHPYFIAPGGWDNGLISFMVSTLVFGVYVAYYVLNFKQIMSWSQELVLFCYGALLIAIPFSSSSIYLTSVVRYLMVCLPFYIYLVEIAQRKQYVGVLYKYFFYSLNIVITIAFINSYYFVV